MSSGLGPRSLLIGLGVTGLAALISVFGPEEYAGSLVALLFGGATYWLVLRGDSPSIEAHGLALGGVFAPQPLDFRRMARDFGRALGWAAAASLLTLPLFWIGYRLWFSPSTEFEPVLDAVFWDVALGHLLVVALPEEMFYRGYLQSRLDQAWPPRWRVLGTPVGAGVLLASLVFALGHLLATPHITRLAVFFPSLIFAWLRARTGGIGSSVLYHAACNVFSLYLARGYGLAG